MPLLIKSTPENRKLVFNTIKAKILKHLEELERGESVELKKTFAELTGLLLKGGKGLPVGTIREWKGKKFIKVAPGKWKPKYDSETRGAKLALSALKKKISQCEDEREMMKLVLENRDRFSDKNGSPLPFVQQLSEFISQTQEKKKEPHLRAFETEYKKTKEWYANAKATSTEIDGLEQEIRSLDRKIKSVKKQGMSDTNPTLAGWYGCQNAQKETLNELKAAKEAGFETVKEYKNAKNSAGSGGDDGGEPTDDGYPEKDYPEYKGKGQKAVDFIVKNKGGQVRGAFNRPEIGDIDVVWGKVTNAKKHTGYGLSHIIDKHGMDAVNKIGEIIKNGEFLIDKENNRISIESNGYHLGLRQQWNGEKKIWIVTNFKKGGNIETSYSNKDYTGEALPETSTPTIPQSGKKSRDIKEKLEQWQKEGRRIIQDERGLNFYEGMTAGEKIEWIEQEILNIQDHITRLKKAEKEILTQPDIDYEYEFYSGHYRFVKPDPKIKNLQKQYEKYMADREIAEKEFIRKRQKEYEAEIKEYQEDIKYYKKQIFPHLTKSIVWLENYVSKSGKKAASPIEVLRKRMEKERSA